MLALMTSTFSQVIPVVDWSIALTSIGVLALFGFIVLTLEDWT